MTRQEQITNLRLNLRKVLLLFGLFSVAILSLAVCVCVCVCGEEKSWIPMCYDIEGFV